MNNIIVDEVEKTFLTDTLDYILELVYAYFLYTKTDGCANVLTLRDMIDTVTSELDKTFIHERIIEELDNSNIPSDLTVPFLRNFHSSDWFETQWKTESRKSKLIQMVLRMLKLHSRI